MDVDVVVHIIGMRIAILATVPAMRLLLDHHFVVVVVVATFAAVRVSVFLSVLAIQGVAHSARATSHVRQPPLLVVATLPGLRGRCQSDMAAG